MKTTRELTMNDSASLVQALVTFSLAFATSFLVGAVFIVLLRAT